MDFAFSSSEGISQSLPYGGMARSTRARAASSRRRPGRGKVPLAKTVPPAFASRESHGPNQRRSSADRIDRGFFFIFLFLGSGGFLSYSALPLVLITVKSFDLPFVIRVLKIENPLIGNCLNIGDPRVHNVAVVHDRKVMAPGLPGDLGGWVVLSEEPEYLDPVRTKLALNGLTVTGAFHCRSAVREGRPANILVLRDSPEFVVTTNKALCECSFFLRFLILGSGYFFRNPA